ncbi:MAG: NAD(P)H-hydrate dehydratase, partial [Cytophagaceae bacterium]|nr:NAD(P)H-hydrate dehydratase [Gemmatimonadaceae bacterium]
ISAAFTHIARLREHGAVVVSLDIPSGVDATTGRAEHAVRADLTICFGHFKRGLLARRDLSGEIVLVDIGLGHDLPERVPSFVDAAFVRHALPPINALAYKGTRRRLLIVGAAPGMAGASVLAARGAQRSGIGMLRFCAHPDSATALQVACPEAVTLHWPAADPVATALDWPNALLIGPGFGVDPGARARAHAWLHRWRGPIVVDADVFSAFAGDAASLGTHLRGRPAVATPHVAEAARILGIPVDDVLSDPYAAATRLASALDSVVLLKGVPTLVAAPDGRLAVVARGTPALGTAGSGDVLAGIIGTLLAQEVDAFEAAASAAWIHGRAAEIAGTGRPLRGVTLSDVVGALGEAWRLPREFPGPGELAALPRVGEG